MAFNIDENLVGYVDTDYWGRDFDETISIMNDIYGKEIIVDKEESYYGQ